MALTEKQSQAWPLAWLTFDIDGRLGTEKQTTMQWEDSIDRIRESTLKGRWNISAKAGFGENVGYDFSP